MTKYDTLKTRFQEKLDLASPWNEYPRPSMKRESYLSLNGKWDFSVTDKNGNTDSAEILVPFPPESALSGYEKEIPSGSVMHYKRRFTLPEDFKGERLLLHFGAVDTLCEVYLNGQLLGTHEGGYLPFCFDATEKLIDGENELSLTVRDDLSHIYPYGKQKRARGGMWYTPVSGIWQSVWAEFVPEKHIEKIKITSDTHSVHFEVLGGADEKILLLGDTEYRFTGSEFTLTPENPKLWSPENPYLYDFKLVCGKDSVESYFALREIGVKTVNGKARLTLNGEPYLFNGLLDQGYFPDGIFLPATSEGYREDILTAKKLGFNMLRKHIKVEPEIFYYLCDKLGMVVFQDMVNNSGYSFFLDTALPTVGLKRLPDGLRHRDKLSRKIFLDHALATVEHLISFPSVLYYTVFNEGWGQFSADRAYKIIKAADPTRIVDATSGWFVQKESDVDSRHVYFKPVKLGKITDRPVVISEFGGYSHRVDGHLFGSENYGYRMFDKREDFEKAFLELYENEILPGVKGGICALVYTQLSDVEDETNGLLTYDRMKTKVDISRCFELMKRLSEAVKE